MSTKLCQCGNNLNLGVKQTATFGVAKKIGFMELKTDAGVDNGVDLTVPLDTAYWNSLLAATDFSARLLLTADLEDYTPSISDAQTVTRASGKTIKTQDGVTSYEMFIDGADGTMYEALKSLECKNIGFFIFDDCGSMAGNEKIIDLLSPKKIGSGTMDIQLVPALDGDVQRIKIMFSLDLSESPAWDIIEASEMDDSILDLYSVCDAYVLSSPTPVSTASVATFTAAAFSSFAKKYIPAEGMNTGVNWTITNVTAGGSFAATTATDVDGLYTVTFPAVTLTDVLTFSYLDNNFELSPVTITTA